MGLARRAAEAVKGILGKRKAPDRKEGEDLTEQKVPDKQESSEKAGPIGQLRAETKKSIYRMNVHEEQKERERLELLENLQAQYPKMVKVLQRYEISTKHMPTWEAVRRGLTPEVLDKVLKMKEPALLLIPPTTRQSKVDAINKHPAKGQKYGASALDLENNDLWSGGKAKAENKWRVSIVEGVQDVEQDPEIYDGKKNNYKMSKAWVKKYEEQGLDVMNDADAYLTLVMKGLAEGKPVDPKTYTVLNGKNLTESSLVAGGVWGGGQVRLYDGNPALTFVNLRVRASVGVDVSQT